MGIVITLFGMSNANTAPAAYTRKISVASAVADAAWLRGGLDEMATELRSIRRLGWDALIVAEVERLYHGMCIRTLPAERLAV